MDYSYATKESKFHEINLHDHHWMILEDNLNQSAREIFFFFFFYQDNDKPVFKKSIF